MIALRDRKRTRLAYRLATFAPSPLTFLYKLVFLPTGAFPGALFSSLPLPLSATLNDCSSGVCKFEK
jgi:hypothetical protein